MECAKLDDSPPAKAASCWPQIAYLQALFNDLRSWLYTFGTGCMLRTYRLLQPSPVRRQFQFHQICGVRNWSIRSRTFASMHLKCTRTSIVWARSCYNRTHPGATTIVGRTEQSAEEKENSGESVVGLQISNHVLLLLKLALACGSNRASAPAHCTIEINHIVGLCKRW
jgi:hypothetical protein